MTIYDETFSSPNFGYPKGRFGRGGHKIIGICLHVTGAHWQSNYSWIMNPDANASYNAVVRDDGSVVSLVPEHSAAYSHGRINKATWPLLKSGVNPNLYTLSLARTGSNQNTWTPQQLEATLKMIKYWSAKYDIPLKRPYIFGHFEIDSVGRWYCPGRGFFDQVIKELAKTTTAELLTENYDRADPVIWHRVVAGSYRNRANAERQLKELRERGIDAFVVRYKVSEGG